MISTKSEKETSKIIFTMINLSEMISKLSSSSKENQKRKKENTLNKLLKTKKPKFKLETA